MKSAIEALHALQVQDLRMVKLEKRLAGIPHRLDEMKKDLGELEGMLNVEKEKLEESHAFKRDQEDQLLSEDEHIRQSKSRMGSAKTPRELSAAQREIESTRRMRDARQEEIAKISQAIESAEGRIAATQGSLDELKETFGAEAQRLEADRDEIEATLAKTQASRRKLTEAVDRELLTLYERVRRRGGGVAFVPVRERRCLACRMQVPHGMYVALKKGEKIPHCESCGRLLFWAGHFPKHYPPVPEPEPAAKPKRRATKKASAAKAAATDT
jgi:predicted  nucleic acid-binding Zn-ribbon protein